MRGDVFDFSFNKISAAQVLSVGGSGGIGYVSHDPSKNWTPALVKDFLDHGLDVGVVWELNEKRVLDGRQAGQDDAKEAIVQASNLGFPVDRPIYFACDIGVPNPRDVRPYYQGVRDVFQGRPDGVYAGANVVQDFLASGLCQYGWLTNATSYNYGVTCRIAHLQQWYGHSPLPLADRNTVLQDDWGGWNRNQPITEDFPVYSQWPPLEKLALMKDMLGLMVAHDSNGQEAIFHTWGTGLYDVTKSILENPQSPHTVFNDIITLLQDIQKRVTTIESTMGIPHP